MYASGSTCSSKSGQVYSSSYDSWGNVTSRTSSGTTATLTFDLLDHFVNWNAGSANKDLYVYDASGTRVLRRTTTGSGTTMRVYAFGLEQHTYTANGSHTSDLYYYSLAGKLLGNLDSSSTTTGFYLTDSLGSVLVSFSNTDHSAAIAANQVFGPYGNFRDVQGSFNTPKGFTGQDNDSLTHLDYYGSRYYDQIAGVFLSADVKQGNMQGMDPYAYVGGNPETRNDPGGQMPCAGGGGPCSWPSTPTSSVIGTGGNSSKIAAAVTYVGPAPSLSPTAATALAQQASLAVPASSSAIVPLTKSPSSCGTPGPSQPLCGNFIANFAVYLSTGGQIGIPGDWCIECGSGGGSYNGEGDGSSVSSDVALVDEEMASGHDMPDASPADTEGGVAGNIAETEPVVAEGRMGPYGQLSKEARGTNLRAHHIFQDAMMRFLPRYSRTSAPAILVDINNHLLANAVQEAAAAQFNRLGFTFLTFSEAQAVAEDALQAAGFSEVETTNAMNYASNWFLDPAKTWSNSDHPITGLTWLNTLNVPG